MIESDLQDLNASHKHLVLLNLSSQIKGRLGVTRVKAFRSLRFYFHKTKNMATIQLTTQDLKDKIFNYKEEQEWRYKGTLTACHHLTRSTLDFSADFWGNQTTTSLINLQNTTPTF